MIAITLQAAQRDTRCQPSERPRRSVVAVPSRRCFASGALPIKLQQVHSIVLFLHRGLDALCRRAGHAGGGDDFCLALHNTVEGRPK